MGNSNDGAQREKKKSGDSSQKSVGEKDCHSRLDRESSIVLFCG